VLLPIENQEHPIRQQRVETMSNLESPHFHARMTSLARYVQYMLNLQNNTARTSRQQRTRLTVYEEGATATAREIERLRHENAILRSTARPPSEQDHKLQEVYRRLSDAEHGWYYTRLLLDITREEVETHTHGIVHLEHDMEAQDAELEERAEMITNLEQQLFELQVQAPLELVDNQEADAMSSTDED
jgi:hypothetical protein